MTYAYDKDLDKWVVILGGDCVIREFDTEGEAKRFVDGEDIGTPEQDIKVLEAYHTYFKNATGIDLLDKNVLQVDVDKIHVNSEWHESCMLEATGALTKDERSMFTLYCLGKLPKVVNQFNSEPVYLEERAVKYADAK